MAMFESEFDKIGKELGLTPQQIKEAILEGKSLKDKAAQLETEVTTSKSALTELQNSHQQVRTKLDELEASSRRTPPARQEPRQYTSVIDDEDKAFDERFADKSAPLAYAAIRAGANAAKMEARMSLQNQFVTTPGGRISKEKLWLKWMNEIDSAAKEVQPQTNLMSAATWLNIFDYIRGKHLDEMMEKPDTFIESVQGDADKVVKGAEKVDKLSDEENDTIKRMMKESKNITPEKYQEIKKKMKFVSV